MNEISKFKVDLKIVKMATKKMKGNYVRLQMWFGAAKTKCTVTTFRGLINNMIICQVQYALNGNTILMVCTQHLNDSIEPTLDHFVNMLKQCPFAINGCGVGFYARLVIGNFEPQTAKVRKPLVVVFAYRHYGGGYGILGNGKNSPPFVFGESRTSQNYSWSIICLRVVHFGLYKTRCNYVGTDISRT